MSPPLLISNLGDLNQMNSGVYCVPAKLVDHALRHSVDQTPYRPNLSRTAQSYLERIGATVDGPTALRSSDPPRSGIQSSQCRCSAGRGAAHSSARMATRHKGRCSGGVWPVGGARTGNGPVARSRNPGARSNRRLAAPGTRRVRGPYHRVRGQHGPASDFSATAGWGHFGSGDAVMPGTGRARQRELTPDEHAYARPRHPNARRLHLRHLAERARLLAERPGRRVELPPRRLSGPEEMALLPRALRPETPPPPRRSPTLHRHRPPHRRDPAAYDRRCALIQNSATGPPHFISDP